MNEEEIDEEDTVGDGIAHVLSNAGCAMWFIAICIMLATCKYLSS